MNRITQVIQETGGQKLLIPFFTAGYPDLKTTFDLINAATGAGADIIEIGFPFSDPLADGPEIQFSSYTALNNDISLKTVLSAVERIRKTNNAPLILMGYYNPVYTYGEKKFMADAVAAGVDGLIVPDLPVDEAAKFKQLANSRNLSTVFLVAPTSSTERIKKIERYCTDFVYAVTVTGVTGGGKVFDNATDKYLKGLRDILKKKFVAGFGVSSPRTAAGLAKFSDGVVIGSRLVSIIREAKSKKQSVRDVERFLRAVRRAIR